MIVVDPLEY